MNNVGLNTSEKTVKTMILMKSEVRAVYDYIYGEQEAKLVGSDRILVLLTLNNWLEKENN